MSSGASDLNDVQKRIVDSLRQDGIGVVPFRELFGDSMWAELEADVAPFVRQTEELVRNEGDTLIQKKYLIRRFWSKKQTEKHRFSFGDPWLRVYASQVVLDIVNTYREQWTKLYYLDNWFTVPFADSTERLASQRWHRDPEDEHVVKVFLYLSDVDEDAGAFEYIRGSARGGHYGELWSWQADGEFYPPQDELARAVSSDDRLALTGPAGTMIFADTGGFHRGGFSRTKPRVLATATYVPANSMKVRRFELGLEDGEADIPAEVRFALDLTGRPH
jgi:hypothetical protein